jgi:hypothetical protein
MSGLYAAVYGQAVGEQRPGCHCGCSGLAGAMIMTGGVVSVGTPL